MLPPSDPEELRLWLDQRRREHEAEMERCGGPCSTSRAEALQLRSATRPPDPQPEPVGDLALWLVWGHAHDRPARVCRVCYPLRNDEREDLTGSNVRALSCTEPTEPPS
jgi:hypothetical protein